MAFPISVQFNKPLKASITPNNKQEILQYIGKSLLDDKADNIVIEDLLISYKGSTSNSRTSLFGTVDYGIFNLVYKNDRWFLNYQINLRKLFIGTAILSAIAEVYSLINHFFWWAGIAAFCWLCGGNWIINFVRHENVATNMAAGIDELICGKPKPIENDEDGGHLKSWF